MIQTNKAASTGDAALFVWGKNYITEGIARTGDMAFKTDNTPPLKDVHV